MTLTLGSTVKLKDGVEIPWLGLGTFQSEQGETTRNAVRWALEAGYRHIDTAAVYGNEADVGHALRESGLPREQVFITTKVWNNDQGYQSTLDACRASLDRLGLGYVDLYLIHWPATDRRVESWKALLELQRQGLCRSVGVSNFLERHIDEILAATGVAPSVNQVEFSAFLYRKALQEYCESKGTRLEAYSPLTRGQRLDDPRLAAVARRYGKTPAQVLIRWCLQHGVVTIPKSVTKERILENADVFDFEISAQDMAALDALNEDFYTIRPGIPPDQWD